MITSIEVKMTKTKQCLILLQVSPMGNAHMLRLQKVMSRYRATIKFGALESQTLGETPLRYMLQLSQPHMILE